jgi:hypothetical protein
VFSSDSRYVGAGMQVRADVTATGTSKSEASAGTLLSTFIETSFNVRSVGHVLCRTN